MPTVLAANLRAFAMSVFEAAGIPGGEAAIVAGSLVDSNLCGHDSHGVIRIMQYIGFVRDQKLHAGVSLDVINETPAILAADANWGLGQVQAYRMLNRLLPKATAVGVACGTMRRCGHIGRLGEYAEWTAQHGLAFFATVNSHGCGQRVAPPGGIKGRISTNPVCFGAPTATHPLILDFSTSACAEGKVRVAFQKGESIPEGWVQTVDGSPTTDPGVLYTEPMGTILPFGGPQAYKGFGLGFMMDIFAGALPGAECSRADRPMPGVGNGVTFTIWNVEMFGGREQFIASVDAFAEYVRSTPTAAGVQEITLPGDPERKSRERRNREGIPIADGTWSLLAKLADELKVKMPAVK